MTWATGTATGHIDLLNQLKQLATGRHLSAVAVAGGGTNYAVGDVLGLTGGTGSHPAKVRVTALGASDSVAAVVVEEGGAYTVDPSTSGNAATGGSGSGATLDLTMAATGWSILREARRAVSATVSAGGGGYSPGDKLTVSGLGVGGPSGATVGAVFNVDSAPGGVVSAVSLDSAGFYEEEGTGATSTDGAGGGCELTVTYETVDDTNTLCVLQGGAGPAGTPVKVAVKTMSEANGPNTAHNWGLFGLVDFNSGTLLHEQASISPGLTTSGGAVVWDEDAGSFVPLKEDTPSPTFPIVWGISVTARRIFLEARVETASVRHYASAYMGFTNPFGGSVEFPYPIVVIGSTSKWNTYYENSPNVFTSVVECAGIISQDGPGWFRDGQGAWREIKNSDLAESTGFGSRESDFAVVYPFTMPGIPGVNPIIPNASAAFSFNSLTDEDTGVPPALELYPTPGAVDPQRLLIPATVISSSDTAGFYPVGELDGLFWFSYADGGVAAASEDRFDIADQRYLIVQSGNRSLLSHNFMAIREN